MENITDINDLISRWGTRREFALAVGAPLDVVHKWAQNNRIPSDRQGSVVKSARAKKIAGVSAEWMVSFHSRDNERAAS